MASARRSKFTTAGKSDAELQKIERERRRQDYLHGPKREGMNRAAQQATNAEVAMQKESARAAAAMKRAKTRKAKADAEFQKQAKVVAARLKRQKARIAARKSGNDTVSAAGKKKARKKS